MAPLYYQITAPLLGAAATRGAEVASLLGRTAERRVMAERFVDAYRQYCWPVRSIDDLRLAPFQILAGEGKVHALTDHLWHLDVLGRLAEIDPTNAGTAGGLRREGEYRVVIVADWRHVVARAGESKRRRR